MTLDFSPTAEWLEADGLGGFASGTVSGERTRRYHALLLAATTPPTGRFVLVNGIEARVECAGQAFAISSQRYAPDVVHPDGAERIESFQPEPWPRWVFRLENGMAIEQELFVPHERAAVALRWRLIEPAAGSDAPVWLTVRPLLSGRDYHSLHHENGAFRFDANMSEESVCWKPYDGVPAVTVYSNAEYVHAPWWYRNFFYEREAERGLDATEDLASPGEFRWDLSQGDAIWIATAMELPTTLPPLTNGVAETYRLLRANESARRARFTTPLERAADAYVVRRGAGRTIIAGYPWFNDWGRDTFIAMRGLLLATGRLDVAREILVSWAGVVSEGMLPNRFPDQGDVPEFNSVDASLWFIIAAYEFLTAAADKVDPADRQQILTAVRAIVEGYIDGTRYRIHVDDDGLLAAGEPGWQLTWMDAKIGDLVVTPRIGKPVEVQALWLNALWIADQWLPASALWRTLLVRGRVSFVARFWDERRGYLADVVDTDHVAGRVDATLRPNQILAVGGLPMPLVGGQHAAKIVDAVEHELLTPFALRSLTPRDPEYRPHYQGNLWDRDNAYHQGTAWPWMMGAFVDAWLRTQGNTASNRRLARERFLQPLLDRLHVAGIGHISEIVDADPPHTPRGCPFQAWSVGELLRIERILLAEPDVASYGGQGSLPVSSAAARTLTTYP